MTPLSASSPYLTVAEFGDRYDLRTICQLLHDDDDEPGDYAAIYAELTNTATDAGRRLATILSDVSGKLESAVFSRGQYTPNALATLTGNSLAYLKRVVADLAVRPCYERRPTKAPPMPQGADEADAVLNALAAGTNIFGLAEVAEAGHMTMTTNTPADVLTRNSVTQQARGFFGRTANLNPPRY